MIGSVDGEPGEREVKLEPAISALTTSSCENQLLRDHHVLGNVAIMTIKNVESAQGKPDAGIHAVAGPRPLLAFIQKRNVRIVTRTTISTRNVSKVEGTAEWPE